MKRLFVGAFAAWLMVSMGCRRSHDHAHDDHEHEPKTAQITVWTDRYEVFAEHTAPVVNKPTRFITHITDLKTAEPRTEGTVKFVLRQGETTFEHPQAGPERPGIYIPAITFPKTGDWQAALLVPTEGSNAVVELGAIKVYGDDHSAAHAEFSEPPEGISFLKEQQWKLLMKIEPIATRQLVERIQIAGALRAKPGLSAAVAAPLAGQLGVPAGKSFPLPGTRVEAGETLAILQPRFSDVAARFIEGEAEFGRAEAVLKQAEREFERTKTLAAQQARTEREVQEAEVALATAKAQYAAAASLRSTYARSSSNVLAEAGAAVLELRAPITGVITKVTAGIGEPVAADQVIFTLLNPETLWVEARVPEAAIVRLQTAGEALCETLDGTQRMISVKGNDGRLVYVGLEVDAATRTVPVVYEMSNIKAGLRAGQAVRLHVETANAREAIAIPDGALVEEGGLFVAFVQVAGETFQKRELSLGIRDGEWIQVLSGLKPGERVVTRGAYGIRLASASGVIPAHGHEH